MPPIEQPPVTELDQTFVFDGPSLTSREATVLFTHYLDMACSLFEVLPEGYTIPSDRFSDIHQEAIQLFFNTLNKAYTALEEEPETETE